MNDFFGSSIQNKAQPMVDFNCNHPRNKNSRKSLFKIFEPKRSSKFLIDNNQEDIIDANNKINSILSKNLKSIYNENKNEISMDTPVYDNVNCLIKNNKKHLINRFLNSKNLSYNLPNDYIRRIRLKDIKFQNSIDLPNFKKDRLTDLAARHSSKKTADFGKIMNISQTPNKKEKESKSSLEKEESTPMRNKSNKRKPILIKSKKRYSSSFKDYNYVYKTPQIIINTEGFKLDSSDFNKTLKSNDKYSSGFLKIIPKEKKSRKSFVYNRDNKSSNFLSLKFKKQTRRFSSKNSIYKFKRKSKEKDNYFRQASQKNLQIPTLKEINHATNKTYTDNRLSQAKEDLNDLENNELTKIINDLSSQNKMEKTNYSHLTKKSTFILDTTFNFNNSEQKELNLFYTQIDKTVIIPEDKLQKNIEIFF